MNRRRTFLGVLTLGVLLAPMVVLAGSQGTGLAAEPPPQGPASVEVMVHGWIPIQGHLTDASGEALNGQYSVTFRIYDDDTDGTVLCHDTQTVSVSNGLFSTAIEGCSPSDVDGTQVYLGIQVESDGEMTPRQPIYAVPYAMSLIPGADLEGALMGQSMFKAENRSSEWSTALYGYASAPSGVTYGVEGKSDSSSGYGGYFSNAKSGGAAIKAAGSGIIQSTARSYVWISGNSLQKANSDDTTEFEYDLYGGYTVYGGSDWVHNKTVVLPITIPGRLYGQNVTVTELELYYRTSDDLTGISVTAMRRQSGVGAGDLIFWDGTDYVCPSGPCTTLHWDLTKNNVLSDQQGILYIAVQLGFASATSYVEIGGGRLTLEHD